MGQSEYLSFTLLVLTIVTSSVLSDPNPDASLNFEGQSRYGWHEEMEPHRRENKLEPEAFSWSSSSRSISKSPTPPSLSRTRLGTGGGRTSPRPQQTPAARHPLDPLTASEIQVTVDLIQTMRPRNWTFVYVTLKEPPKSSLLPFFLLNTNPPRGIIPRRSFAILLDRPTLRSYEVTVNLDRGQIEKWDALPDDLQPALTIEEMLDATRIAAQDPEVIRRCRRLGWTDMSLVVGDPWYLPPDRPEWENKRLIQLYLFGRMFEDDMPHAHPFDFLPVVDLSERRVIEIEELPTHDDFNGENKFGNVVPRRTGNYHPDLLPADFYRTDVSPVNISQPGGPAWTVNGNEVSWQKFKFRVGFNGREGILIHHVNYEDENEVRPLFYRMSLAEMFIPYADPRPPYHRKYVFDQGKYGLGSNANSLKDQVDCVGTVHYFNYSLHDEAGQVKEYPMAVCMHEEDAGILWKHTDFRTGKSALVRSQRLALSFIATIGSYDYVYTWNFYQDATIEFNVKLTGILGTNLLAIGATTAGHGTIVSPQINAMYHQHFFSLRIDPEIDGNRNTVAVSDVIPLPEPTGSPQNPYGQGFTTNVTVLRTSSQARTSVNTETSRTWLIRNPNRRHPYTRGPVAWKLIPWPTPPTMLKKGSRPHQQAEWLDYTTWVTPYDDNQMFPAGYYLNNSGLPEWVRNDPNADIDNEDVVIWHTVGVSHVPRVEDYPSMPVEYANIMLKPFNFFNANPSLDVPGPPAQVTERDEL